MLPVPPWQTGDGGGHSLGSIGGDEDVTVHQFLRSNKGFKTELSLTALLGD